MTCSLTGNTNDGFTQQLSHHRFGPPDGGYYIYSRHGKDLGISKVCRYFSSTVLLKIETFQIMSVSNFHSIIDSTTFVATEVAKKKV